MTKKTEVEEAASDVVHTKESGDSKTPADNLKPKVPEGSFWVGLPLRSGRISN